jgi:tRNA uracil 4-sulfurtransferase
MNPVIIVHHHEITLKGDNRRYFERQLLQNIRNILKGLLPQTAMSGGYGRFVLHLDPANDAEKILQELVHVFGLANICIGVEVEQSIDKFCSAAVHLLDGVSFKSICVRTVRSDKKFQTRSMEVNAIVGARICEDFGVRANLTQPEETIFIEIADGTSFVYRSKLPGAGGLPSGVSGKVVTLISAGFDSPVAAWKIMKRGATNIFVHFHSLPYTSRHSLDQVRLIVEQLTRYQLHSKLYLVPFADLQNEIVLKTPQHLRVVLYRRFMLRIAEIIALDEKAEALVTGEAVGQVASQTLRNIRNIEAAVLLPILRPLSGTDKEETMVLARRIGTHDISKEPYDDCCSFLAPRKPETWSKIDEITDAEAKLDIPALLESTMSKITTEQFSYPTIIIS